MSNVVKSKRRKHDFETTKQMHALRRDITEAMIIDFGYDPERHQKMIERYAMRFQNIPNNEEIIRRMKTKHDSFYSQFIYKETEIVLDIWKDIVKEFEMGNSIFPTGKALMEEYKERRLHFDRCIGHIHSMRLELQYIAETLPCDKNKYDNFAERLKTLSSLVKGVRQASNRFLKKAQPAKADAQGNL
jgi:hypothetical protein